MPPHDAVTLIVDGKPGRVIPGAQHDVVAVGPYQAVAALVSDSDWAWRKPLCISWKDDILISSWALLKTAGTSAFSAAPWDSWLRGAEGTNHLAHWL